MSDDDVVAAIQRHRLADHAQAVADDPPTAHDAERARRALDTCGRIAADVAEAQRAAVDALAGIVATPRAVGDAAQRHEFTLDIAVADAPAAAAALGGLGYRPEHELTAGAARSQLRHGHELAVRRTDRSTTVARLRWRTRPEPTLLRRLFVPTPADWAITTLPRWAWWGYSALRPGRLLVERARRRPDDHADLEPFLATPDSLIEPLLDAAGVTADDVLVDIGCGDGRIVVEAARRRGCRAVGAERSAHLAAEAERRAAEFGVSDRVEIICGDGLDLDLTDATVAVMFLPVGIARRVVPQVIGMMSAGSRVLIHEQGRLPADMPAPDTSLPLIADDAVSVAHLWVAGPRSSGHTEQYPSPMSDSPRDTMTTLVLGADHMSALLDRVGRDTLMDLMIDRLAERCRTLEPDSVQARDRDGFRYDKPALGLLEWMPTHEIGGPVVVKMVGYHPTNPLQRLLPSVIATTSMWDSETGHLVAIADATLLTAVRTGAASAVATGLLTPEGPITLGVVGLGAQAVTQVHAISRIRTIDRIVGVDADDDVASSFAERVAFVGAPVDVRPADARASILGEVDVLCTCTSVDIGAGPVVDHVPHRPALHINAIGADFPGKTELPADLLDRAFVVPDVLSQCVVEGECQQVPTTRIGPELTEIVRQPDRFADRRAQLTVYDSTGWAVQDAVALQLAVELARQHHLGTELQLELLPSNPHDPYDH